MIEKCKVCMNSLNEKFVPNFIDDIDTLKQLIEDYFSEMGSISNEICKVYAKILMYQSDKQFDSDKAYEILNKKVFGIG